MKKQTKETIALIAGICITVILGLVFCALFKLLIKGLIYVYNL
jgi:hypothetical protein